MFNLRRLTVYDQCYVMSKNMGGDYKSMGLIISTQTVLSMLTIPIWLLAYHVIV